MPPEQDLLAKWHFIRPWHPRLSLFVKEITSVSATFVILSLAARDHFDPDDGPSTQSLIPDPLSKGVSVKVNGTPWPKCLARLSDNADEAMIIVYGLMPGRHYDIELGLIAGEKLRGQIVTDNVGVYCSFFSQSTLSAHFARSQRRCSVDFRQQFRNPTIIIDRLPLSCDRSFSPIAVAVSPLNT